MEKKERMRIKGITMILSCLLLFAGCGENGGSEENVSTETAGQKVSEENSGMGQADAGMEFVELPVQTEQKLTENDFKVMKSLVGIQAGERQGSGVIYDEEENRILIATAGHVLADDTGEARVTFPDGTQVAATAWRQWTAAIWLSCGWTRRNCQRKHGRSVCRCRRIGKYSMH